MSAVREGLFDIEDELPAGVSLCGGAYVIEKTICQGGFGIVYRTRHKTGKVFAVKEFFVDGFSSRNADFSIESPADYADEIGELLVLFTEEGWWPSLMSHPNVMRVFNFFEENQTCYIVLEHIEGADLQDIMEHYPDWLEPHQILKITKGLADGLAYMHANGVVHGDIAPDNVIMRGPEDPVLIDFGSALFDDDEEQDQRPPAKLRAVKDGYSAPELYNRRLHPTTASDIYSLGATVHHMLAGRAPAPAPQRLKSSIADSNLFRDISEFPSRFLSGMSAALSLTGEERPTAEQLSQICRIASP